MKTANGPEIVRWAAWVVALGLVAGCGKDDEPKNVEIDAGVLICQRDEHSKPELAAPLGVEAPQSGYICPEGDRDWYKFDVPADETVVSVALAMDVPLSPVEISYSIWTIKDGGGAGSVVAAPPFTGVGSALDNIHCIDPGAYLLSVNDAADDSTDLRNAYGLEIKTRPDQDSNEPNNTPESATAIASGQRATGYITCPGDYDHFKIDVPAGNLIRIRLESETTQYEPTITLKGPEGQVLAHEQNLSGRVRPTLIERYVTLPSGGTYHVIVADDDGFDAAPETPYILTVDVVNDIDLNEPNNTQKTATPLSASPVICGSNWSQWYEMTGTIGAPGDNDWFRVPVQNCEGGILEAHVEFDTAAMSPAQKWEFSQEVQASVTMVIPEPSSPCNEDSECRTLQVSCSEALDCAGLFEQCLPEGLCAGASVCLSGGFCGANRVQRNYQCDPRFPECRAENTPTPPPNKAGFAAPLPDGSPVFLRVSDYQSDGASPDTTYRLRVRVRQDPDMYEPSNIYTNKLTRNFSVRENRALASPVVVHDCTGADPTCCSDPDAAWTTGMISYENDFDWYSYEHPCPGEDCMLKFHYRVDAGPVDTVMNVYTGTSAWHTVLASEQRPTHPAISGSMGGVGPADSCFYSFQGHEGKSDGTPYKYGLLVRDLRELYSDDLTPTPESSDWDPDQAYSFCIEKVFNGCQTPCKVAENGECTVP